MATKTKKWQPPDREQRASEAVVRAAKRWRKWINSRIGMDAAEIDLALAVSRLADIQKKEKRRVR